MNLENITLSKLVEDQARAYIHSRTRRNRDQIRRGVYSLIYLYHTDKLQRENIIEHFEQTVRDIQEEEGMSYPIRR